MSRRVRRKVARRERNESDSLGHLETGDKKEKEMVDWTRLPDDTVIHLFTCLNTRDLASLSSTCKVFRALGTSSCLWQTFDLRSHKCDWNTSSLLAPRCSNLRKLRFRGAESADVIINLLATSLREISEDYCRKLTDSTLAVIAAHHECLESLQLGPDFCERISSDAIKAIALCCLNLGKLLLSAYQESEKLIGML